MLRPDRSEYADYYHGYIARVPDGDIVETLEAQRRDAGSFLLSVPEGRGGYRYAEGKWTLKDVIGHVVDAERVFGFRALAFARRDPAAIPGMEQDDYVAAGRFAARSLESLREEFDGLRRSHVALFGSFDDGTWSRRGTASGVDFTVRAVAWILAGHAFHHLAVIRERYL